MLSPVPLGEEPSLELPSCFTVSTWNVWFDKHHREERFAALLDGLKSHGPDIMAFQEVTLPFVRAAQSAEWLKGGYWISSTDHNNLGTVLVSRVRPSHLSWTELPTKMGRRMLTADFPGGLRVGVVHLESLANSDLRQQQLAAAFQTLKPKQSSILLGDFNFGDGDPEGQSLDPDFPDAWPTLHPGNAGFTYDTLTNPMACTERETKQERLDRVLFRGLNLQSVETLGTLPLREGLFPSDHFGLLTRFQM